MLYQIINNKGLPVGVHECSSKDLSSYLKSLPVQSSPYSVIPEKAPTVLEKAYFALNHKPLWHGLAWAAPVYVSVTLAVAHYWSAFVSLLSN